VRKTFKKILNALRKLDEKNYLCKIGFHAAPQKLGVDYNVPMLVRCSKCQRLLFKKIKPGGDNPLGR